MKFRIIYFLVLLSLAAQGQVLVGLKVGISLTGQYATQTGPGISNSLDLYQVAKAKPIVALNGGFYVELKRNKNLSLQPELIFKAGGYQRSFSYASGYSYDEKFKNTIRTGEHRKAKS